MWRAIMKSIETSVQLQHWQYIKKKPKHWLFDPKKVLIKGMRAPYFNVAHRVHTNVWCTKKEGSSLNWESIGRLAKAQPVILSSKPVWGLSRMSDCKSIHSHQQAFSSPHNNLNTCPRWPAEVAREVAGAGSLATIWASKGTELSRRSFSALRFS